MTPEQFTTFEQKIVEATEAYVKAGGIVAHGVFYASNSMCPISCFLSQSDPNNLKSFPSISDALSDALGFSISKDEMWDFVKGFDHWDHIQKETILVLLGRKLRQKYCP